MVSSERCQEPVDGAKSSFRSLFFRHQTDVQICDRNQLTSAEPVVISGPERVGKLSYTDIYHIGVIGKTVFVFVCVYAPQANLSEFEKDRFYQMLQCAVSKIPASEQLIVCGDWNGHIGSQSTGFEEVHGGQAIGKRNTEGERILEFAFANELAVGNTWFKKKLEHLVTYQSGNAATQIDFILYRCPT